MALINVRVSKDSIGSGDFDCPKCGSSQAYTDTRKTTVTSLYGIIPIKTKKKDTRKCGGCGTKTELAQAATA